MKKSRKTVFSFSAGGASVQNYLIYGAESDLPRRPDGSVPIRPGESAPSVEGERCRVL
jgi:hypothetical protein